MPLSHIQMWIKTQREWSKDRKNRRKRDTGEKQRGNANEREESNHFFKWLHWRGIIYYECVSSFLWLRCISFAPQLFLNRLLESQFSPPVLCKWNCWPASNSWFALSGFTPNHCPIINDSFPFLTSSKVSAIYSLNLWGGKRARTNTVDLQDQ